jgi:hypothetical protein
MVPFADSPVVAVFRASPLGTYAVWMLALAGLGISLWVASIFVVWLWQLVSDLIVSDERWDADARAHGYADAADRARDHW